MSDTYKCAMCGEENEKAWTDEEALKEKELLFPGVPLSGCVIVCDTCFEESRPGIDKEYADHILRSPTSIVDIILAHKQFLKEIKIKLRDFGIKRGM